MTPLDATVLLWVELFSLHGTMALPKLKNFKKEWKQEKYVEREKFIVSGGLKFIGVFRIYSLKKNRQKTWQFSIKENNLLIEVIFWCCLINSKQILLLPKSWYLLSKGRHSDYTELGSGGGKELSNLLLPHCVLRISKRFFFKKKKR